jgi:pimeloyl-ACP methyl ester carboxylesterase
LDNVQKYGDPPFKVAVIHGGPGAAGSMAPVARELSHIYGILEPLQTASSIDGQVMELRAALERYGQLPVTLIGHSWGAWLSLIFAARYPSFVKKLVLVGSGPLEEKYTLGIMGTRLNRLNGEDRQKARALMEAMDDPGARDKNPIFAQFGKLMSKADSYDPIQGSDSDEGLVFREDVYRSVWREAEELRRSGELLRLAGQARCPVLAVHGDYDPHPAEGVEKPLRQAVKDFRLILLKDCGHEPWKERRARDRFYEILIEELVKK